MGEEDMKEVQLYNSVGKKQTEPLKFIYLDMNVKEIEDTKLWKDFMKDIDNKTGHWKYLTGCAIPLEVYPDICKAINKITDKAYKKGLYYGAKKK